MVGLNLAYVTRQTWFHTWDLRWRFAALMAVGVLGFYGAWPGRCILAVGLLGVWMSLRFPWGILLGVLRDLGILLGLAAGILILQGMGWREALEDMAQLGSRIFLILMAGVLFSRCAKPEEVVQALRFYLGFLGRRRAYRVAFYASLALGMVGQLHQEALGVLTAFKVRGGRSFPRLLRALTSFLLPLTTRTFLRSYQVSEALLARGWGTVVPPPIPLPSHRSGLKTLGAAGFFLAVGILGFGPWR